MIFMKAVQNCKFSFLFFIVCSNYKISVLVMQQMAPQKANTSYNSTPLKKSIIFKITNCINTAVLS